LDDESRITRGDPRVMRLSRARPGRADQLTPNVTGGTQVNQLGRAGPDDPRGTAGEGELGSSIDYSVESDYQNG